MSRSFANVSKIMPKQDEEQEMEEAPKAARKPRGTSPYVQVKVRRDIYEMIGVIAKMNSMTGSQVVEKILEAHTDQFREGLNSLKLTGSF
jgi:hypothetical protein